MPSFTTKEARTPEEIQQSRDIRFAVFIDEQVRLDSAEPTWSRTIGSHAHERSNTWHTGRRPTGFLLADIMAETDFRNSRRTSRSMSESCSRSCSPDLFRPCSDLCLEHRNQAVSGGGRPRSCAISEVRQ